MQPCGLSTPDAVSSFACAITEGWLPTLCWNRSGRGRELKSSSASAMLANWTSEGTLRAVPNSVTRLVSLRTVKQIFPTSATARRRARGRILYNVACHDVEQNEPRCIPERPAQRRRVSGHLQRQEPGGRSRRHSCRYSRALYYVVRAAVCEE